MSIFTFWKRDKSRADTPKTHPGKRSYMARSLAQLFKASKAQSNDNWGGMPTSIDAFITLYQVPLVARSREQWSNNDYVRGFVRLMRQNIVGPNGVVLQGKVTKANGKPDKNLNQALEKAWCKWSEKGNCDVTGKLSFREIQNLCVETTVRDGEFLLRVVYGKDAGPFGFALQVIDPQRLMIKYENTHYGNNGHFIRQGIEFNQYGRVIAYHFSSLEEWDAYYYTVAGRGFVRIPADEIIHGFVSEVAGQKRGLPWASTSLYRLHHLQGFEDASVQNARASATKMGFFQWKEGYSGPELDDGESIEIEAEPLGFHELPQGAEFVPFDPQYPNGEFQTFHKAMVRGASVGMGVPYNDLASDLENVNFSSIRQGTLDSREHYKEKQQWLIESLCNVVFRKWLEYALLDGQIKLPNGNAVPATRLNDLQCVEWKPRRWAWIDPRADVDAFKESVKGGFMSVSQVIREQGRDPETVFAELANDIQEMKSAGIPDDIIHQFFFGVAPPPPAKDAPAEKTTKDN